MTGVTVDRLEAHLLDCVAAVSQVTSQMLPAIRALDVAQVTAMDGARRMDEWLAGRFDLDVRTARTLGLLARANDERIDGGLAHGETVDRVATTAMLIQSGADQDVIDESRGRDIAGVRRMASARRRMTSRDECDMFSDRFLHIQPSLDDARWKLWGQLSGVDGRIVEKARALRRSYAKTSPPEVVRDFDDRLYGVYL